MSNATNHGAEQGKQWTIIFWGEKYEGQQRSTGGTLPNYPPSHKPPVKLPPEASVSPVQQRGDSALVLAWIVVFRSWAP